MKRLIFTTDERDKVTIQEKTWYGWKNIKDVHITVEQSIKLTKKLNEN